MPGVLGPGDLASPRQQRPKQSGGLPPSIARGDCHAAFHSREMRVVALLFDAVAASGVAGPRTRGAPRPSSYRLVAGAMNAPWTACPTGRKSSPDVETRSSSCVGSRAATKVADPDSASTIRPKGPHRL